VLVGSDQVEHASPPIADREFAARLLNLT
jgi:hypothetical protein